MSRICYRLIRGHGGSLLNAVFVQGIGIMPSARLLISIFKAFIGALRAKGADRDAQAQADIATARAALLA